VQVDAERTELLVEDVLGMAAVWERYPREFRVRVPSDALTRERLLELREILDLVPGGEPALSLRCGGLMERCRIVTDERTLAFRVTLGRVDPGLSENRRLWLGQLLMDAGPVRLVRTGLRADGDGAWCAEAEVDLSGAPGGAIEVLVPAAVAALHRCYAWLAYPVTFLVDPACKSVALSERPRRRTD
ncbi:MAG: hypothetical protein IH804_04105, partial [Planctomycetes bacterium]|nr:hypothetical protein [Planctomycetota bacterium]